MLCTQLNVCFLHYILIWNVFLKCIKLLTSQYQCGSLEKKGILLQPLCCWCIECMIHHERDVREEQHHIYVVQASNNRVIMACELYCWLLPQCEALRTCRSCFLDRNSVIRFCNSYCLHVSICGISFSILFSKLYKLLL